MRKEIILNNGWIFHKGDIEEPISKYKGFISQIAIATCNNSQKSND